MRARSGGSVCAVCAHHLDREAADAARGPVSAWLRRVADRLRGALLSRGVVSGRLGEVLRAVDRRLPW